ncbi:MAG: hypothetical protein MJ213_04905 [Bacilli bacterium]|nr:hypothetical protein [Bacilli bacterium]
MNKQDRLSDESLVLLHQRKKINAFFIIYNRYKNYGYSVISNLLVKYNLVNALQDEKDAILYDTIMECLEAFDPKRGSFRKLFNAAISNLTANYIRDFQKDPLSDYISLDASIEEGSNYRFADSLTFADKGSSPKAIINLEDKSKDLIVNYDGVHKRRIKKMIRLREEGYTFKEIAKKMKITEKAARAIFYRIRKRIEVKDNAKNKK